MAAVHFLEKIQAKLTEAQHIWQDMLQKILLQLDLQINVKFRLAMQ